MTIIRELRTKAGLKQSELADLVETSQAQIGRLENGDRKLTIEWAAKLAPYLGVAPRDLMFPPDRANLAPLVGHVGAGTQIYSDRDGDPEMVPVPPGISMPVEVVVVRGDSMYPVYRDGDRLIFESLSRGLDEMVGKECVVQLADGRKLVKTIRRVGTEYALESFNAPPITDVVIEAAWPVRWIERK